MILISGIYKKQLQNSIKTMEIIKKMCYSKSTCEYYWSTRVLKETVAIPIRVTENGNTAVGDAA